MIFNTAQNKDLRSWAFDYLNSISFANKNFQDRKGDLYFKMPASVTAGTAFQNAIFNNRNVDITLEGDGQDKALTSFFQGMSQAGEITLNCNNFYVTSMDNFLRGINFNTIGKITIHADTSRCTSFAYMFRSTSGTLHELDFIFDFSSATNFSVFTDVTVTINEMRFKPNTLSISFSTGNIAGLSKESRISLANCLKDGVTGKSLAMGSGLSNIIGTVSQVTENGVTYNFFTEDENGDTTLQEFITDVKGWTIA